MLIHTLILLLILVDFKPMLTSVSAMMLILVLVFLFVVPILLQIGIVMLTLAGILAFIQVWMFLMLIRKLYSYTANKIQL